MTLKIAWGNVRKSFGDFGIYFVTVVLGVAVFYAFNSMSAQQGVLALSEQQSSILDLLGAVIGGVSVFIAVLLVFLVVYANRFLIRRRKKEFGLYLALGMGAPDVVRIVLAESAIVGVSSLVVGLALGIGFSQVLLLATSSLFSAEVANTTGIAFLFSPDAFAKAVAVFAAVFVLAAIVNSHTVAHAKLVDLLRADRTVESMKLRSLPLSFALFIVSLVVIGAAYKLLADDGLTGPTPEFAASTVLVVAGTALFFYSLSGFLLRAMQSVRPLYLRGLNMFTLRQLNARVNTAFATLTVVCLVLFLAITSVCTGLGLRDATEDALAKGTSYSATASTTIAIVGQGGETHRLAYLDPYADFMESVGYDMREGLTKSMRDVDAGDFDALVAASAQLDSLYDTQDLVTYGAIEESSGVRLADAVPSGLMNPGYEDAPLPFMRLSQVNAALELAGKAPIDLGEGECAVLTDMDAFRPFWDGVARSGARVSVGGKDLAIASARFDCVETTTYQCNTGALVLRDEDVPADCVLGAMKLDMRCASEADEAALSKALGAVSENTESDAWPLCYGMFLTRTDCQEQSIGVSVLVGYLAIYLGFVLVIACAAILAIQQLSDASDNARRYGLLRKLGADGGMVNRALFVQVLVYFLFPLVLAVAHSACAISVVSQTIKAFGRFDIASVSLTVAGAFALVYGAYFLVTFFTAKRLIRA